MEVDDCPPQHLLCRLVSDEEEEEWRRYGDLGTEAVNFDFILSVSAELTLYWSGE